ncbi:hypothetical protein [Zymomonas mobilis]|uniref:hypothetical protein n=1 Tax=Zymomonas mobilis TaxID=542 RepID=UPI00163AA089|nr:hypothetical protein [Zymomonas mobilis]
MHFSKDISGIFRENEKSHTRLFFGNNDISFIAFLSVDSAVSRYTFKKFSSQAWLGIILVSYGWTFPEFTAFSFNAIFNN